MITPNIEEQQFIQQVNTCLPEQYKTSTFQNFLSSLENNKIPTKIINDMFRHQMIANDFANLLRATKKQGKITQDDINKLFRIHYTNEYYLPSNVLLNNNLVTASIAANDVFKMSAFKTDKTITKKLLIQGIVGATVVDDIFTQAVNAQTPDHELIKLLLSYVRTNADKNKNIGSLLLIGGLGLGLTAVGIIATPFSRLAIPISVVSLLGGFFSIKQLFHGFNLDNAIAHAELTTRSTPFSTETISEALKGEITPSR